MKRIFNDPKIKMMGFFRSIHPIPWILAILFMIGASSSPIPGWATDFQIGSEVKVEKEAKEDLYIAGGEIHVNEKIGGDLTVAGGKVNISDSVGQDLLVSAGELRMDGEVGDDIRIVGGRIEIKGTVGGDLLVFGGNIHLEEKSQVKGMVKVFGGSLTIEGVVEGKVELAGGKLDHRGRIEGDLKTQTGHSLLSGKVEGESILATRTLDLKQGASFHGDVHYWRRKGEVDLSPYMKGGTATLDPALKHKVMGDVGWTVILFGFWLAWLIYILSAALILFLLNYFLTRTFQRAGIAMEHIGKSLGFGALYVFGVPIASILLLLTVIGAPIALVLGTLWGLSMLFTHLLTAVVITHWLKVKYNKAWDRIYLFLVSLGIYMVIKGLSLIPILGWLFSLFIVLVCFGALLLARRALFTNRPMVRI
ncbi:MAG: hypothetical protein ABEH38_02365 [Flavobacteriales bacterium]